MIFTEDDKLYFVIFFDVDLPMLPNEARQKRVTKEQFKNLIDECVPDKTIELVDDKEGKIRQAYTIVSKRMFHLKNSVDNTLFLICDIKKTQL